MMRGSTLLRTIGSGLAAMCVAFAALLVLPGSTASATELRQGGVVLENLLKREQIVLNNQQERLTLSDQVATTAQQWITDLQAEGNDVSALQAALTAFQAGVAQARISFDTARQLLDAHAGFDASGQVTGATQALKTASDAGRAERQCHLTLTQATIDFRAAVRAYRQANH
ncbi:MAG: hypothetical protein HY870_19920 [Chloroflexi bacterium]|nr:hypothetical protein [Chloroflexota bacterium]